MTVTTIKSGMKTTFVVIFMSVFCFVLYVNTGCEVASDVIMGMCCPAEEL